MSADEIDAELLAMAGDSSDGEGSDAPNDTQAMDEQSEDGEAKPSVEKTEVAPASSRKGPVKGVAQKVRKRGKKKVSHREIQDELDDLGDGSSSPAASLGSRAMSESGSAADAPGSSDVDEGPLYPLEGKFMSAQDRSEILSLPEIKREEILAERAQEVLKQQQDVQLRKALAATRSADKHNKRKAAAADLDDDGRKTSRAKTDKTGRSALDDYKKAREAKGTDRGTRVDSRRSRRDERSPSSHSDRDADGESEVEFAEPSSEKRGGRKEDPPGGLRDFDHCTIGRTFFTKHCFDPGFEDTMKGCFCRVNIGMHKETGQNIYRMTLIKGFTQAKPYELEGPNGRKFRTNQYAIAAHGKSEKPWPLNACSDSRLTDRELDRYIDTCTNEGVRIPRLPALEQQLADIKAFVNKKWDDSAHKFKFDKAREMAKKLDPAEIRKTKRATLETRLVEAEESGDMESAAKIQEELDALDKMAKSEASPAKPSPAKVTSRLDQLAAINHRNRGKSSEDVRNALLAERRKIHQAREAAARQEQAEIQAARKRKLEMLARPKPGEEGYEDSQKAQKAEADAKKKAAGGGGWKKKKGDEDELGGLDLGIEIEI